MSPSNETTLNRETEPLAPLEHLLQRGLGATANVALGVLLGILAARVMRNRHLHWSWATVAFALVLLARTVLAGSATTLGVASLGAAVRGRRWHSEDLQVGADLAEIAASRTTPLDSLRGGLRRVRSWLRTSAIACWVAERCARWSTSWIAPRGREHSERWLRGGELGVGTDRQGRPVSIELGGAGAGTHTLVVGATGSGKTVTQAWIAARAIAHGMGAVVVDPKGERWMREQLRARGARRRAGASSSGRRRARSVYNPYAHGRETEIADKALAGERFTEPHYQRQAQRYLGHAVRALRAAGREVSLAGLVEALDPRELELLARALPRGEARRRCTPTSTRSPPASGATSRRPRPPRDPRRVRRRALAGPARRRAPSASTCWRRCARVRSSTSASKPTAGRCSRRCWARRSCRTCRPSVAALQGSAGADARGDRRVLRGRRRARREAVRPGALGRDQPAAGHPGARGPAPARARAAAGAGAGQPHER